MAKQKQNNELEKMLINPKMSVLKFRRANDIECIKRSANKDKSVYDHND
ncbi:hypothetical protein ID0616_00230 [Helicobacter pylori]